jgi:hypothetical protein
MVHTPDTRADLVASEEEDRGMTQTRLGTMPTDRPARYAKQLAGHWARKGSAGEEDGATVIRFDTGQLVVLRPEESLLSVRATVPEGADPDRFAQVVADHLQRFGQRDELEVLWDPPLPE